jgi:hypothetical protein
MEEVASVKGLNLAYVPRLFSNLGKNPSGDWGSVELEKVISTLDSARD